MAQKKIVQKVKTANGYDTLFPQTLDQVCKAKTVSGTSAAYTVTIDMPAAEITEPILVLFTPNVSNAANATININGLGAKALYLNNASIAASQITTNDICIVYYGASLSNAKLINISSATKINKATSSEASAGTRDDVYLTPKTARYAVEANDNVQLLSITDKSNQTFSDSYAVTGGRILHYDILASGYTSSRYTQIRLNGTNIGGSGNTYKYLNWNATGSNYATSLKLTIEINTYTHIITVTVSDSNNAATVHQYKYDSLTDLTIKSVGNAYSLVGYKLYGYSIGA